MPIDVFRLSLLIALVYLIHPRLYAQSGDELQWPGFRGPQARGYIESTSAPVSWSVDSVINIKWTTPVPGLGHSCPVVWDNYLFITTAVNKNDDESLIVGLYGDIDQANDSTVHSFMVYCLNKNTGEIIWERIANKGIPKSRRHTKSSQANCTPATDGRYLVVNFGSEGLYCYDLDGNEKWKKDLGILNPGPYTDPGIEWGFASSPVIWQGVILIQCDIPGHPFIAALDLLTGQEKWRTSRGDEVSTWCTPTIYSKDGRTQVIANGYRYICGYDFESGKEIWRLRGGGDAPVPTPVTAHDLIYLNSAHGKYSPVFVIRPEATGDITLAPDSTKNKFIVWSIKRGGAYMQTPLIYDGYLYNLQVNGQLTCFDALTGDIQYKESLNEAFTASGIATNGKLYFTSEAGHVFVISAGPRFKILAVNKMNDVCMATPAISGNSLFFRTQHAVIAISL